MLTGCGNLFNPNPKVVTHFKIVKTDIPDELLTPATPPDASVLVGVKVCKGADALTTYGKALVLCNYKNTQKLYAIKELIR
jgi:hypothetical protein